MRYLSVCSGIEAASVAWHPLGFTPLGFAEIDPFACSVLAHRFPGVTNFGDLTNYRDWELDRDPDIVVGGTPCQSFSVAGLRKGMADPRGNLALTFLGLVDRVKPTWVVWENVPGVLSSNGGRDFGAILGALAQLGYGFAYRVLDAQYFGVPQRRRRVFVVGHRGDWRRAAAVLFDSQSMRWNPTPSRKAGKGTAHDVAPCLTRSGNGSRKIGRIDGDDPVIAVAGTINARKSAGGGLGTDFDLSGGLVAGTLGANHGNIKAEHAWTGQLICGTLQASGKAAGSATQQDAESGLLVACTLPASDGGASSGMHPVLPVAFSCKDHGADAGEISPTLRAMPHDGSHSNGGGQVAIVAIQERAVSENLKNGPGGSGFRTDGMAYTLEARGKPQAIAGCVGVRRLMPIECERLQGFPDNWTLVPHGPKAKPAADGPRYKAIGNSMAVPVMAWIGQRIKFVEGIACSPAT